MTDTTIPGDALSAFTALILADEALQAQLGTIELPDDYVAAALGIAAAHGIALDAATCRAALRPDPGGLSSFMPSPVTLDRWPAQGWLPARSVFTGGAPALDWAWFGAEPPRAPFYEESVLRVASRPLSRMFRTRTSLEALVRGMAAADGPAPAGFIHHLSRCGSTLAAQMLGAAPDTVVLSEPEPLDAVVRWAMESGAPPAEQVAALRAIVAALSRDRSGTTRRVIFKLDSWHVMALPLFRRAFPDVPWAFLYRDPLEVLVSQRQQRGIHTVAGLLPVGILGIRDAEGMDPDAYAAEVLKRMGEAVLEHWHVGGGMLIDYTEMPQAIVDRIAPHFGWVPDAADRAAMLQVATRSAKAPDQPFTPDSAAKRRAATQAIEIAARDVVGPAYDRLERLRCSLT